MTQEQASELFAALHDQQFANLTTFRKSGAPVATPVWFALNNGKVYVMTAASTGKIKRIRNDPRVQLAPSDRRGQQLGPPVDAQARILPDSETALALQSLNRKYGLVKRIFDMFMSLRRVQRVFLEISPA